MLLRLIPVFFVISICAATFIISFILFYLHSGPRLLLGHPRSFTYFPLIDFETKRLQFIDISDSLLDELVRSQTQTNFSRKSKNSDLNQWPGRFTVNKALIHQHTNGAADDIRDLGKTSLEAEQNISMRPFYNRNRSKHFQMLEPKSVETMFIDHQRFKKQTQSELEMDSDWVPKSSPAVFPAGTLANVNSFLSTTKVESGTGWETEQTRRRDRIRTTCDKNKHMKHLDVDALIRNRQLLTNFLVDDEHQLIYCYVPKVACTQWKRVFIALLGKSGAGKPEDIPHMIVHYKSGIPILGSKQYTDSGIRWRLESYTKFVFSRHPFERILSAYRDKFESNSTEARVFSRLYGHPMIRALGDTGRTDYSLSFTDMLRYLSLVPSTSFQEHWKPIYNLCHPCSVNYTYIGSFNDLEKDGNNILNRTAKIGSKQPSFPSVLQSGTPKLVRKYLAKVPSNVTMPARKVYQMDFDMFGYK